MDVEVVFEEESADEGEAGFFEGVVVEEEGCDYGF